MFSVRYWTFFAIVLAALGYTLVASMQNNAPRHSPADSNSYRYDRLDNGLKVLLVHTPNAQKAAAAVSVEVGSGDDPKDRQGLAHFLEHMLFLGTEPYPDPEEYQAFINRNGGSHNAFTAHNQTTYFFDIDNSAFEGALKRFAPFFISPTFAADYVEREKNAVQAEYMAKYKDDFRRIYSGEKQAMNPEHPFAQFSVGSLDTLADRDGSLIRDELLTFYANHYSADRMTLVLAGNYPLDQLEKWANDQFQAIPKRQTVMDTTTPPLFVANQLPLDLNLEPIKEIRRLQFSFPMPENQSLYQYKILSRISSLLGDEGEGSLLAFLKQQGWAEGLTAGQSLSGKHESLLTLQIQLTPLGLANVDRITQALLYNIDLIKAKPWPAYLFNEQKELSELAFRFQEQPALTDLVIRLSSNMLIYPKDDIIYGDYRYETPSQAQLEPFFANLNANNMLRTLIAPKVSTDTVDPWYGTPMRIRPLNYQADEGFANHLSALHLPAENPFIPTDFSLRPANAIATPETLIDRPESVLWYYPEHEFKLPKARVLVELQQAKIQQSAREQVLAQLYARTVNEALNTYSYPAALAGLNYHLKVNSLGLELSLGGYQHKLPVLLERILTQMDKVDLSEDEFQRYRDSLQRMLENQLKNKPYERAIVELRRTLIAPSFSEAELLASLTDITRADVLAFGQDLQHNLATRLYVHGSLSKEQALEFADVVDRHFKANAPLVAQPNLLRMPTGTHQTELQLAHHDNLLLTYIQGQNNSDHERARYALLGQILSSPYYQRLRTEEQLGYVVFASQFPQQTVPGLVFLVQSPNAKPQHIWLRNQVFFNDFAQTLANMSAPEFDNFKQGLITALQEKPQNLGEKSARYWQEIGIARTNFDTNSAIAAEVAKLTLDEIQQLYKQVIIEHNNPQLAFTQGGKLTSWPDLNAVTRSGWTPFALSNAK